MKGFLLLKTFRERLLYFVIGACYQLFLRTLNKHTSTVISRIILRKPGKTLNQMIYIYIKSKNIDIPPSILNNGKCITESATIANIFNDFFHSAVPIIQSKIKFSCKSFNIFL